MILTGGTIYISPTERPISDGTVVIREGTIVAVQSKPVIEHSEGEEKVDCSGMTITAGFWNSHVHFFERKWSDAAAIPGEELARQLQDYARFGFTSVFDLGSMWHNTRAIRDRIDSGEVPGPKIRSTGEALLPPDALPSDDVLRIMGFAKFPAPEIKDKKQAAKAARKLLDAGVDAIKLFVSSPRSVPLPENVIQAAVEEAHRENKPAFVHPNSGADILAAVHSGVDIIAHTTPYSGPWDDALLTAMSGRNIALTPTLRLWGQYMQHDRISTQERITTTAVSQLRAWLNASGTVLFGTDVGAVDTDPTEEYELMAQAGMNFEQVLASLTTAPAERFGESQRFGRVAECFQADLVVLREDPREDIRALTSVAHTIRAGRVIYSAPAAHSDGII